MTERALRKTVIGIVASDKMDKTVTVTIERKLRHPLYGKFMKQKSKFMAHDEQGECRVGDKVRIQETRPLSKKKRWRVVEVMEKAR